jgi:DNA polymerase I
MHNLIIDGSNLLYAILSVNDDDYCDDGYYIGGVIGSLASISKIIQNLECNDRVFVTYDLFPSEYRKAIFKEYKAKRHDNIEPRLKNKFSYKDEHARILYDILPLLNCHVLVEPDVEADDVIANYVKQTSHYTTIVSNDRDFFQLINDKTSLFRPVTQEFITPDNVDERLGYEFKYFKDVKIMSGDASDNISGIPGVAEKTALKIINQCGSNDVKQIREWADTKKGKYIDNLKLFIDQGLYDYNKKLMDLDYAPEVDIRELIYNVEYDKEKVLDILKDKGYNRHISDWVFDNFKRIKM